MASDISTSERQYIRQGIEQNIRNDGRERLDYRVFSVETGVIPQANGSARFKLEDTDILVGVNLELGEPDPLTPSRGKIICSVECSPSASLEFEGYGSKDLNTQLTSSLDRILLQSNAINLESLCLIPGKQCWIVYVDAVVLDSSGNLLDCISMATKAAFSDTRIPAVKIVQGKLDEMQVEVSDDPFDSKLFEADTIPICVSLTKIGPCFIVDATAEEEMCVAAQVTIAVNSQGTICGIDKHGKGGMDPSGLSEMIRYGRTVGLNLLEKLKHALEQQDEEQESGQVEQEEQVDDDEKT